MRTSRSGGNRVAHLRRRLWSCHLRCRHRSGAGRRDSRRWRGHLRRRRVVTGKRRQIERRASGASARSADRRSTVLRLFGSGDYRLIAQRSRRTWRIRILRRIEYIRPPSRTRCWRRHVPRTNWCSLWCRHSPASRSQLLQAILGIVLHALELHLELLITILKLLDSAGQLAQGVFHAVEPNGKVAGIGLRHPA